MLETQLLAGGGKEFGAISRAAIGEDALDLDAVVLVKSDGLVERGEDAGSFFIGEETGKSDSGMVIDGDVQAFHSSARVAMGTIAGGADAGLVKTAKLFNIKMKELPWSGTFVADDRRFGWFEGPEAIKAMALEDTGKGSFGDGEHHEDLGIGTALATEGEDLGFEVGRRLAWLAVRDGGMIIQPLRRA